MKNIITTLVVLLPFVFSSTVYGAGFALYEYSAKGTAMGGATVANGAEAASLANNPALITELEGTQIQVGATAVVADATTTVNGDSRSLKDNIIPVPNFYITHKWSDDISLGLGGFTRFGLGGEYQDYSTWAGSTLAYKMNLETFSLTPTIAIKANDEFSMAMGLEAMIIGFEQEAMLSPLYQNSNYKLSGSGVNWGGNFSFLYKPEWAEKWALGAMYRTKVKTDLTGRIRTGGFPGLASYNLINADVIGSIVLPDSITAGLSFKPTDKWTMEAGIVGTFWSSYDQILIQYTGEDANRPVIRNLKKYKDTYRLNFGTEYKINDTWAVRAGYVFDKSPINEKAMDTMVPVDDRHIASIGAGYATDNWTIDAYYGRIFGEDLSGVSTRGETVKYSHGHSDLYGITVGYKF
ncbi:MAG: long-chain fatty acid transporter [Elusimicrobium sp.]|uniref:Long-chain fatty acid transporter n=1 Tax=Candidatus Avelusimicrobium gallicola TaxID=2562704 RepID=A0A928HJ91_9BACT|nr:long-chain fatty acid transporter [Elusimicrobium sp.]